MGPAKWHGSHHRLYRSAVVIAVLTAALSPDPPTLISGVAADVVGR